MTKEQEERTIAALLRERRGYEARVAGAEESGDADALAAAKERVAQVDAQLKRLGAGAKRAVESAERRPSGRGSAKR